MSDACKIARKFSMKLDDVFDLPLDMFAELTIRAEELRKWEQGEQDEAGRLMQQAMRGLAR